MAEFAYNNEKNACTGHTLFELNYSFHPRVFYEEDSNFYSKSKIADQLTTELHTLIFVYRKNLQYA